KDDEVVQAHHRREAERGAQGHAHRDLPGRAVGVERLEERLDELEDEHPDLFYFQGAVYVSGMRRRLATLLPTAVLATVARALTFGIAHAQSGRRIGGFIGPNAPYDGRFTFVLLMYTNLGGRGGWAFDYPAMERNFMTILEELTTVGPHVKGSNVLTM